MTALRALAERVDPIGVATPSLRGVPQGDDRHRDGVAMLGFHALELLRDV